ncbi:MAG: hypothetical protein ACYCXW_19225, partial [Solirubrobacteraceae bacterium]
QPSVMHDRQHLELVDEPGLDERRPAGERHRRIARQRLSNRILSSSRATAVQREKWRPPAPNANC